MAKYQTKSNANFNQLLSKIEQGIVNGSISASLEEKSDMYKGDYRCSVRVFERYSYTGKNRVSLTVTLFGKDGDISLSAITSGGSQGVFFKLNTFGEDAFLQKFIELL